MQAKAKVHGKAALTGKGQTNKTPANADSPGPSNHVPVIAKPQAGASSNYSSEQQQQ
jgi:hypothetical protein